MTYALVGARIFHDNTSWLDGHAVVIQDRRISAVTPEASLDKTIERHAISGLLVPGFIDVQVNGGGGVLFNDEPNTAGIAAIGAAHRTFGTTGFLPTFITDKPERMRAAVAAIRDAVKHGVPGLLGVHLEGPFLNPARKGIHDADCIRPMQEDDIRLITDLARDLPEGFRVHVTLAPEMVSLEAIDRLIAAGVILSAGHTAASAETIVEARKRGLSGFTHLYNAMPPLSSRDPGPVGVVFTDPECFCGLIVDLHHVSPMALKAAIRAHGPQRMMLVSDAMSSVGDSADTFQLLGRKITRAGGRLTGDDGTLAGSDLDMVSALRNTVQHLDIPLEEALRMASHYPAMFLHLDNELGRIAPGYRANLVSLNDDLTVSESWIDGKNLDLLETEAQ